MAGRPVRLVVVVALVLSSLGFGVASAGPSGGALPPVLVQAVRVAGQFGVPEDAVMVAVNVTAVGATANGYLTVYSCDEDPPATSNVNYVADQAIPNLVLSRSCNYFDQ